MGRAGLLDAAALSSQVSSRWWLIMRFATLRRFSRIELTLSIRTALLNGFVQYASA
ncbi:MAG: hypothetical protein SNG81_05480 [Rikenellaceae bacterium]